MIFDILIAIFMAKFCNLVFFLWKKFMRGFFCSIYCIICEKWYMSWKCFFVRLFSKFCESTRDFRYSKLFYILKWVYKIWLKKYKMSFDNSFKKLLLISKQTPFLYAIKKYRSIDMIKSKNVDFICCF